MRVERVPHDPARRRRERLDDRGKEARDTLRGKAPSVSLESRPYSSPGSGLVVFVGSAPSYTADSEIRGVFEAYGAVARSWSFQASGALSEHRCAFVVYAQPESADRVFASMAAGGRLWLRGSPLVVERPEGSPPEAHRSLSHLAVTASPARNRSLGRSAPPGIGDAPAARPIPEIPPYNSHYDEARANY